jgi:hypothetical protein
MKNSRIRWKPGPPDNTSLPHPSTRAKKKSENGIGKRGVVLYFTLELANGIQPREVIFEVAYSFLSLVNDFSF